MIRFACKQCGAKIRRPDDAAGTLVFCACGQSNRVPWESTEPDEPEPRPQPKRGEAPPRRWEPARRQEPVRRDPDYCFNHQDRPQTKHCADCGENFCDACVVTLQDDVLCGPCKNFRIRSLNRPKTLSALALISAILGLASNPLVFCASLWSLGSPGGLALAPAISLFGALAPLTALLLGVLALRQVEGKPGISGRGLAVTGMTTAAAGLLWCLTIAWVTGLRNLGE